MQAIYKNEISGRSLDHNEKVCVIRLRVLPTTPFVKALVCWATGKRLTHHLPKLSLITYVDYTVNFHEEASQQAGTLLLLQMYFFISR